MIVEYVKSYLYFSKKIAQIHNTEEKCQQQLKLLSVLGYTILNTCRQLIVRAITTLDCNSLHMEWTS